MIEEEINGQNNQAFSEAMQPVTAVANSETNQNQDRTRADYCILVAKIRESNFRERVKLRVKGTISGEQDSSLTMRVHVC